MPWYVLHSPPRCKYLTKPQLFYPKCTGPCQSAQKLPCTRTTAWFLALFLTVRFFLPQNGSRKNQRNIMSFHAHLRYALQPSLLDFGRAVLICSCVSL